MFSIETGFNGISGQYIRNVCLRESFLEIKNSGNPMKEHVIEKAEDELDHQSPQEKSGNAFLQSQLFPLQ
jgi:hypothetical protein